jgi:hypothetical protein
MLTRRFLFFCLLVFPFSGITQELYFDRLEPPGGLPSQEVYHLLQDSKGYIWFTTDGGICRYNGKELKIFTSSDGLPENVVFHAYEDHHGRIWFTSLSGYVFFYSEGKFQQIAAGEALKRLCQSYLINSLFIGENDTLFCSVANQAGVLKLPPEGNYAKVIHVEGPYANANRFILQNKRKQGECLMGAGKKLVSTTDSTYGAYCYDTVLSISMKGTHVQAANAWKGELDDAGNCYLIGANILTTVERRSLKIERHIYGKEIICATVDKDGDIWVGFKKGGVYCYKNKNLNAHPLPGLLNYSVTDVILDKEGNVWVSTLEKGVFISRNKHILTTKKDNNKVVSLGLLGGQPKIGWDDYLLQSFNGEYLEESSPDFPYRSLMSAYFESGDKKVILDSRGLHVKNGTAPWKITFYDKGYPVGRKILESGADTLKIVASRVMYTMANDKITGIVINRAGYSCVKRLRNGTLLVGTREKEGLLKVEGDSLVPYSQDPSLRIRINDIKEDSKGVLWLATNEYGVFRLDRNGRLDIFSTKAGLISDKVNALSFSGDTVLWVGTNKGLSKLILARSQKLVIRNFDRSHGLPVTNVTQLLSFGNWLFCAGGEYLYYFDQRDLKRNTTAPPVNIYSFEVNSIARKYDNAEFGSEENNMDFFLECLSYKAEGTQSYVYKLEGYDQDWNTTTDNNLHYTNLGPGKYQLLAYALNNDGQKSRVPASLAFSIGTPFWAKWWMILLELIAGSGIVILFVNRRISAVRRKEMEKTFLNKQIAEFHMTALRAQMNPHFIFNAISSIQHYILKNDTYSSYEYLAKFAMLIRKVLDQSQEQNIPVEEEINTLRLYVELEQLRFKEPFEFKLYVDKQLKNDEISIPTMLVQPYVENAIWHGLMPRQKECELFLSFEIVEKDLVITIRDNGVGRKAEQKNKEEKGHLSKGMVLSSQRLEALRIGEEKDYSVFITDLTTEKKEPAGTEVKIIIPLEK